MKASKQKLLIEYLISSEDIYVRCINILESKYFDPEYRVLIIFIKKYYEKYRSIPPLNILKGEFDDIELETHNVDAKVLAYASEEIEEFARKAAIIDAIQSSFEDIENGNLDIVSQRVMDASQISLERDLGVNLYDDPEKNLVEFLKQTEQVLTGVDAIDDVLEFVRQQLTLFSANSGVGKSIVMANVGALFSLQGLNVVIFSLELSQGMIYSRLSSIVTREGINSQRENIPKIASLLKKAKERGAGDYTIKRLPAGSSANDMRSYLKQYEAKMKRKPDVIIIDYLDKMNPNGGVKSLGISEQAKLKSEQVYEIGIDYDAVMISASQQNREALRMSTPDQAVIAGGLTKVNEVDNYVSIYMTPEMRVEGIMLWFFLKTRSNSNVGSSQALSFNSHNLVIDELPSDKAKHMESMLQSLINKEDKKSKNNYNTSKKFKNSNSSKSSDTVNNIPNLPKSNTNNDEGEENEYYENNQDDITNLIEEITGI
jgi:hypothetical protein